MGFILPPGIPTSARRKFGVAVASVRSPVSDSSSQQASSLRALAEELESNGPPGDGDGSPRVNESDESDSTSGSGCSAEEDCGEPPGPPIVDLSEAKESAVTRFRELLDKFEQEGIPLEPGELLDREKALHEVVARECLDPIVGELIQKAHDSQEIQVRVAVLGSSHPFLRLQNSLQPVRVTLLGGSTVELCTAYYLNRPPRGRGRPKEKKGRGKSGNGLYPVLKVLGLHWRASPALVSEVARLVALGTVDQARANLAEREVRLDRKVIRRIAVSLAQQGLTYRAWMERHLEENKGRWGRVARGKRLVISTDGGRIRLRFPKRGRRRKSGRRGFYGAWKEPKVLVVYEVDERGKTVRGGICRYDATLRKANGLFDALTAVLREIGAHEATEWIVVGDGAGWIWDRVPKLIESLGYDAEKVTEVADFYHAVEHLHSIAAEVRGWSDSDRKKWTKRMRHHLRSGALNKILDERSKLCWGRNAKKIRKAFNYFEKRRDRMRYDLFRKRRIPLGSGAVESCVRRVINLRLKGNGIFWSPKNAEGVMHLRAQLLSGRWDEFVKTILRPDEVWSLVALSPYEALREKALEDVRKRSKRMEKRRAKLELKAA